MKPLFHAPPTRREFLHSTAAAAGALAGMGFLSHLRPVSADEAELPAFAGAPRRRHRADRPAPGRDAPREAAGGGRLPHQGRPRLPRGAGRPARWPACATCSPGRRSASSSTRSWSSTPPTWPAWRRRTRTAGCRSSGRWTASRPPRPRRRRRAAGGWARWTRPRCRRPTRPARRSCGRWTGGTSRRPTPRRRAWPGRPGRNECFELFARYGRRDFRDIGHKAIYVANSFRTLECIGWQHAEPVLRSLAYALLQYDGDNPATADTAPDRPWRREPGAGEEGPPRAGRTASPTPSAPPTCSPTLPHRLRRAGRRGGRRGAQRRARPAVGLGRGPGRVRRAADAPQRHRHPALGDQRQRPALRLRDQRRRRDAACCCCCRTRRSCRCSARRPASTEKAGAVRVDQLEPAEPAAADGPEAVADDLRRRRPRPPVRRPQGAGVPGKVRRPARR